MTSRWLAVVAIAAAVVVGVTSERLGAPITLRPTAAARFTVADVTIVEPGLARRRGSITIDGERIAAIGSRASRDAIRRYALFTALPGLVDMHVHVRSEEAELVGLLFLAHGVTTVRDAGDTEQAISETVRRVRAGELVGPRIFTCGRIVDGEPPVWEGSAVARTAEEGAAIVERLAANGVDCVKAYRRLSPPALEGMRAAAERHDLPLIGHVPDGETLRTAALDDVQHLTGVLAPDPAPRDAVAETRAKAIADGWGAISVEEIAAAVRASIEGKIAHTPTLVFWERYFRLEPRRPGRGFAPFLPSAMRADEWDATRAWNEDGADEQRLARALAAMKRFVGALHAAGGRIHAGTDALGPFLVPGESLWAELDHLADAGLGLEAAWAAATRVAGESLGDGLGRLRPGAPADVLLFREDPTRDLAALDTLEAVIVRGRLYRRVDIERRLREIRRERESPFARAIAAASADLERLFGGERKL